MASVRIKRALKAKVPPASTHRYKPGDHVIFWREKQVSNRIVEWLGSYEVASAAYDQKLVYVRRDSTDERLRFNLAQVKRYLHHRNSHTLFMGELSSALSTFASTKED